MNSDRGGHEQSILQIQAALWEKRGFPNDLLLRGVALREARSWATNNADDLTHVERDFLEECGYAEEDALHIGRRQQWVAWLAAVLAVVGLAALHLVLQGQRENELLARSEDALKTRLAQAQEHMEVIEAEARSSATASDAAEAALKQALAYGERIEAEVWDVRAWRLASLSRAVGGEEPELAALLALEAFGISQNPGVSSSTWGESTRALEEAMAAYPFRVAVHAAQATPVGTVALGYWEGDILLAPGAEGGATAWDMATGTEILRLPATAGSIERIWPSPDGLRVLCTGTGSPPWLWDAVSGRVAAVLGESAEPIHAAAWSADGSRFVIAQGYHRATIWHAASNDPLCCIRVPSGTSIRRVAWGADDSCVLTTDPDGRTLVWDARTGEQTGSFGEEAAGWLSVQNRRPICQVTVEGDGMPTIYVASWSALRELACARAGRNLTQAEWARYVGSDIPYRRTCAQWPAGE